MIFRRAREFYSAFVDACLHVVDQIPDSHIYRKARSRAPEMFSVRRTFLFAAIVGDDGPIALDRLWLQECPVLGRPADIYVRKFAQRIFYFAFRAKASEKNLTYFFADTSQEKSFWIARTIIFAQAFLSRKVS